MDEALTLLKEEINKTLEAEHDLGKWKLAVTAALGAAAFGLAGHDPNYWLLLFVPFVCAYIDLYSYQYEFRVRVIARFLREHPGRDAVLQIYEQECERLRGQDVFSLGNWAGIGSSLGASVLGPVVYFLRIQHDHAFSESLLLPLTAAGAIWFLGALLIFILWRYFQSHARTISGESDKKQHGAAA